MYRSFMAKPDEIERKWYVVDAEGKTLGRLASQVASILRGKHKPTYTPNVDCGDFVIVINAEKVVLTGKKMTDNPYHIGCVGCHKEAKKADAATKAPTACTGCHPKAGA